MQKKGLMKKIRRSQCADHNWSYEWGFGTVLEVFVRVLKLTEWRGRRMLALIYVAPSVTYVADRFKVSVT
jgi:hypothetical protein